MTAVSSLANVLPAPSEVEAAIRRVPRGKLTTIQALSDSFARQHGTTIGCTVTTGIFAWMVAQAAHESESMGAEAAPYWRVLKAAGELNVKYPGGAADLQRRLEAEGHTVVYRRGRYWVENYAARLAKWLTRCDAETSTMSRYVIGRR